MFSSNQKFVVNGRGNENLLKTLELVETLYGSMKSGCFSSYKIDNSKGFILGWYGKFESGFTPFPYDLVAKEVFPFVVKYLSSDDAKRIIEKTNYPDIDGSVDTGWEVYYGFNDYDDANFYSIIAIKPVYLEYHK